MLIKLMLGVQGFQNGVSERMNAIFKKLSLGQFPGIFFITCLDSRIVPTHITGSKPGDMFVLRNVGNIIPAHDATITSEAAAIAFTLYNDSFDVKDIIVCGHSDCGAVKGLLKQNLPNKLAPVASWLQHSIAVLKKIEGTPEDSKIEKAIQENVLLQIEHLKTYPGIAGRIASGELAIHGWYYDLGSSKILIYQEKQKKFIPFEEALAITITTRRNQVLKKIVTEFLTLFTRPQSVVELKNSNRIFSELQKGLHPIWPYIRQRFLTELWAEVGELHQSQTDPEFTKLVEEGVNIRLDELADFRKALQESLGHHEFCGQVIRQSWVKSPLFSVTGNQHPESKESLFPVTMTKVM